MKGTSLGNHSYTLPFLPIEYNFVCSIGPASSVTLAGRQFYLGLNSTKGWLVWSWVSSMHVAVSLCTDVHVYTSHFLLFLLQFFMEVFLFVVCLQNIIHIHYTYSLICTCMYMYISTNVCIASTHLHTHHFSEDFQILLGFVTQFLHLNHMSMHYVHICEYSCIHDYTWHTSIYSPQLL